jgi:RHS repeat-associated protein
MVGTTSRFSVNYVYDANENLYQVVNAANPTLIYWEGTATDAFGHITTEILGNGIVTGRAYDPNTGALQGEASGVGSNPAVADRAYTWDADGNLSTRQDNVHGLTEIFSYDNLNRVQTAAVTGGTSNSTLTMGYDLVGNIMSKSSPGTGADMGAYTYDATHPMEIATITSSANVVRNFQYDNNNGAAGNGNLVNDGIRTYTWDAENRPTQITNTQTGASTSFAYSPDGMRYAESTTGSDPSSLTEVNGLFQVYTEGGHASYRNSIAAPTGIVAIYTVRDDSLVTTRYLTTDHLGSSSEITNEVGVVTEAMSYDVFGAKRDPNTWQTYAFGTSPNTTDITDKGYTGQQQLDALGLIHLNGRVQDPYTGRFVSADPTVPDPFYSQAFNRFAYVYNNPLNLVDPSGFDPDQSQLPTDNHCDATGCFSYTEYACAEGSGSCGYAPAQSSTPIGGVSFGTQKVQATPSLTPVPDSTSSPSVTASPDVSQYNNQSVGADGFRHGGTDYNKFGIDANGNDCDCSVPNSTGTSTFQSFNPDSLGSTCLDCSFQSGNVDWGSAGGSLKYMPLHNGPAPRAGIAGGGGPKVAPTMTGTGSLGNTSGLGRKLTDLTAIVLGDISTGLSAAETYGQYIARSNPSSVALAERLGGYGVRFGIVATASSIFGAGEAFHNKDNFGGALDLTDAGVGGVALWVGGLPGFVGGASYTAVRATGLGDFFGSGIANLPNYGVSQYIGPLNLSGGASGKW